MLFSLAVHVTLVFFVATLLLALFLLVRKIVVQADDSATGREADRFRPRLTALLLEDLAEDQDRREVRARLWRRVHGQEIGLCAQELSSGPIWRRSERRKAVWSILEKVGLEVSGGVTERVTILLEQFGYVDDAIRDLSSRRWWVRVRACRRLGLMRSQRAFFPLVGLLHDREEIVREAASDALIETIGVDRAIGPILHNIRVISTWFSIKLSAAILTAGSSACEPLIEALDSRFASVRLFAVRMLGELKEPAALPFLLQRIEKMDIRIRIACLLSLGKIGDRSVYQVLLRDLSHPRPQVRKAAVEALGVLGSPDALQWLEPLMLSDELPVRQAVAAALACLEEPGKSVLQKMAERRDPLVRGLAQEILDAA